MARPKALTVPEAAAWLGISPSTLYKRIAAGDLPGTKVGAVRGVRTKDLETWILEHRVRPGSLPWARQVWDPVTRTWSGARPRPRVDAKMPASPEG